jgi:hypothetical protein
VQKTPSERIDVAKQLGMPPSTLNKNIAKEKIREHSYVCATGAHHVLWWWWWYVF